jgi:protein SCO1/2
MTHSSAAQEHRSARLLGASLYQLASQWTNQEGKTVAIDQFRGKPLVLAMAYTSCQATCPILVSDMQQIEKALPASLKGKVQFALFSFDSKNDTPETLKTYGEKHGLDPSHWTLLMSKAESVRELAAVLGVRYKENADGDISHSNVITVLNAEGEIVHQQVGLRANSQETVQTIQSLLK